SCGVDAFSMASGAVSTCPSLASSRSVCGRRTRSAAECGAFPISTASACKVEKDERGGKMGRLRGALSGLFAGMGSPLGQAHQKAPNDQRRPTSALVIAIIDRIDFHQIEAGNMRRLAGPASALN